MGTETWWTWPMQKEKSRRTRKRKKYKQNIVKKSTVFKVRLMDTAHITFVSK